MAKNIYTCKYCMYKTRFHYLILKHYSSEHESYPNFSITCGIDSCVNSYSKITSLRKHILRKHKQSSSVLSECTTKIETVESTSVFCVSDSDDSIIENEEGSSFLEKECSPTTPNENIDNEMVNFILNLRVKKGLTEQSTELVQKFSDIIDRKFTEFKESLANIDTKLSSDEKAILSNPFKQLDTSLKNVDTVYKQNLQICQGPYVAPITLVIERENIANET